MAEATSLNATVSTQASLAQCECPVNFIRAPENRRFFVFFLSEMPGQPTKV